MVGKKGWGGGWRGESRRHREAARKRGKKKGQFYKVVGVVDGQRYRLGYTSSKLAFMKEMIRQGWKKSQLKFIKQ